jgi:Asp-tRNA(Asn)/Glu-tRNA(Gln) amidotransferase A subunit family amidase
MAALLELGVTEAAEALRTGALTAEALTEALLASCVTAAPLNAFISLEPDKVRADARRADQQRQRGVSLGPLHGVPLVIKDNVRRPRERPPLPRIARSIMRQSCSDCWMPVR